MRKIMILWLTLLICLFVIPIPEENIPNVQIGVIQKHNYELEDEIELTTPQIGSFTSTTLNFVQTAGFSSLFSVEHIVKINSTYIQIGMKDGVKIYRSSDLDTWTEEFSISNAGGSLGTALYSDGTNVYALFHHDDGTHYNLCWCISTDDGTTWTNGSGGADGTYNEAGALTDGYDLGQYARIYNVFKIGSDVFAYIYDGTDSTGRIIDLSDFSSVYANAFVRRGLGCLSPSDGDFYFPVVLNGETNAKLQKFDGSSVTTHSTIFTGLTNFYDNSYALEPFCVYGERNGYMFVFSSVPSGGNLINYIYKYNGSTWDETYADAGTYTAIPFSFSIDPSTRDIIYYRVINSESKHLVFRLNSLGEAVLIYNTSTVIDDVSFYPYITINTAIWNWTYTELTDVSECVIKKDGTASFNDFSPTTRFVEKQYVELYNGSNNLVYQGFITKIDRIDLIQKLVHLKSLANYDLEKQLADSYTTKTYYEMIETSIDNHALYLTYSLDHTPVTTYTMDHKKTLAELIKWGTKQESLKDYVTPATVLTIDDGTTDTTIDVSDADGDVIDEYKSYEITYNPSIVILYGGFVNGVRLVSTWRSTVIGDQPFSDNYPEVVDQTQLDNLAEAIGTGKDFKILVFEFTVFNKAYIQPGQQIDFQYTLDQTNYPVLASKAKYYVISNEIDLSQDSQFIRISDALIDEAKGDQKNGLTVENSFQLIEQVQSNVNTVETDAASTYLKKTGVETQNLLLKVGEAASFDIKEGVTSYLKFTTSNGAEVITAGKPIAMGTNKITGLGAATAANDALSTGNLETTPTNGSTVKGPNSDWAYKIESETCTLAGVKTFSSFPVTPSSLPTTNYQVANKLYVDNKLIVLYKPDDENRTDTNFASDGDLTASFSASSVYKFRFVLFFTVLPGAADVKVRVHCSSAPTTIQGMGVAYYNLGTTAASVYNFALDANDEEILNKDNASDYNDSMMIIEGMVFTNGATTFDIQWAQRADSGTTTLGKGSYFEYSKVA